MQAYAEMQSEIAKLQPSQRAAMRSLCGTSRLDAITVEQVGWKTRVRCETRGFRYSADLGPRGKILKSHIH